MEELSPGGNGSFLCPFIQSADYLNYNLSHYNSPPQNIKYKTAKTIFLPPKFP